MREHGTNIFLRLAICSSAKCDSIGPFLLEQIMTRFFLAGILSALMLAGCSNNDNARYDTKKPVIDTHTAPPASPTIKGGDTTPGSSANTGSGTGLNTPAPTTGSSKSSTTPDSTMPESRPSLRPMDNDPATPDRTQADKGAIQNVDPESNNPNPATPSGGKLNND